MYTYSNKARYTHWLHALEDIITDQVKAGPQLFQRMAALLLNGLEATQRAIVDCVGQVLHPGGTGHRNHLVTSLTLRLDRGIEK